MKIAVIRRIIFASVFFIAAFPMMATGNEIDGFRLGMTMEQAMKVAAERGYSFGKAIPSSDPNWTSYFLSNGGPAISFCGNMLSAMTKTSDSDLHEFTHLLEQWTKSLGAPDRIDCFTIVFAGQTPQLLGLQVGARKRGAIPEPFSVGYGNLQMLYGYGYINHPCRSSTQ